MLVAEPLVLPDFNGPSTDSTCFACLPDQVGGFVAYRHFWTDKLRSTVALGALKVDNPTFAAASSNKRFESAHLNLIYSPVPNTNFGAEYIYGRRETEGGLSGSLNRLQASFQYSF